MLRLSDDHGRELLFPSVPKRVVSLVPSDTLSLADLGCGGALVGRTDYCELPEELVKDLPSVGGTKNPKIEAILDLSPDLVLANQEENSRADIQKLLEKNVRVYIAFPKRVAEGIAHLAKLARIFRVERDERVRVLCKKAYDAVSAAEEERAKNELLRAFCPIWMDPLMTIHGATFISDMMSLCGADNVFADRERRYPLAADIGNARPLPQDKTADRDIRYPRVTLQEVTARAPELVLLPDEPHPFTEEDADVFRALPIPAAKTGNVFRMSGKDLCWYGSRSADGIDRVRAIVAEARKRAKS
ncbi:MAG: helical backbone metal receptor [Polyangiaceae bacterium]